MNTKLRVSKAAYSFIELLKGLEGAIPYDGDCSVQVAFRLSNGKTLRFGCTDSDVGSGFLFVDQYAGLAVVGGDQLSNAK